VSNGFPGGNASDSVFVTVQNVAPVLYSPIDQTWVFGTTGHAISWMPLDPSVRLPMSFTITMEGTPILGGSWSSGALIVLPIDGLDQGRYHFTCTINDGLGGSASDNVTVTVISMTNLLPGLSAPADQDWTAGSTGHDLSWTPTDASVMTPTTYTIFRNSVAIQTSSWFSGSPITVNINGLTVGTYTFTCVVNDGFPGSNASDSVVVGVHSNILPMISKPMDQAWIFSTTGHVISWMPTDASVQSSPTFTITVNGDSVINCTWISGTPITIVIDGLAVGQFTFTCTINDGLGGSTSSEVTVNVTSTPSTTPATTTDPTVIAAIIFGIGGIALGIGGFMLGMGGIRNKGKQRSQ
jgi:hypothetical protein